MASVHILFQTDRFNVSGVKDHFINPCCFGEDAAQWLGAKLAEKGVTVEQPGQEDWGWYLLAEHGLERYILGLGGYHTDGAPGTNDGEWRIIVEKKRSLSNRILGGNAIAEMDPLLSMIEDILHEQSDVRNIRRERI